MNNLIRNQIQNIIINYINCEKYSSNKIYYVNDKYFHGKNVIIAYMNIYDVDEEVLIDRIYKFFIEDKNNVKNYFSQIIDRYNIIIDVIDEYISMGNIRSIKLL